MTLLTHFNGMNSFALFTDASFDPRHRRGVGAYLLVPVSFLEAQPGRIMRADVARRLKVRRFENTSSSRIEVQTVIWALDEIQKTTLEHSRMKLKIYTESQCVAGLPGRQSKLSACDFMSQKTGKSLRNADLYRAFYESHDNIGFSVIKVAGHMRASLRDTVHHIFAYVDQEARKALKRWNREPNLRNI